MSTHTSRMEQLLEEILKQLRLLTTKEVIPQIDRKKNLSFLFDKTNARWTSFRPIVLNNMRLFGYYYHSDPSPVLTEGEEGFVPLRVDNNGKLLVNTT